MELETPDNNGETANSITSPDLRNPINGETLIPPESNPFFQEIDSTCSTPYVSAPSSPSRCIGSGESHNNIGFFYSAPASPMHFINTSSSAISSSSPPCIDECAASSSFEFEFSARFESVVAAEELFLNGQIRPMKLSSHLQRPQVLAPLIDLSDEQEEEKESETVIVRGRDLRLRDRSLRRRTRSMSPLRNTPILWLDKEEDEEEKKIEAKEFVKIRENDQNDRVEPTFSSSGSGSSSRSSSAGRSSKRWIFLKDLLYRSKSEGGGRTNTNTTATAKFWSPISSSSKDKKSIASYFHKEKPEAKVPQSSKQPKQSAAKRNGNVAGKAVNGVGKRRIPSPSAHELHYTANRAQAEEMRKKTFLPYRQGLLGCLGFSSKSYGAMNGFARALNPVSSR
ncbi:Protein of unknown function DUF1645, plant [Dillenia turbinata]|uniref:Uncharacterized protein n=1 Tax=Dillenia turbinata TaxID=194707 RepID=A0AAN8U7H3_9MAGN